MESKYIQRVTFAELSDAKSVMMLVQEHVETQWAAYQAMGSLGLRPNAAAFAEARKDIMKSISFLIEVMGEFQRLHVDCTCPVTHQEIEAGKQHLAEALERVHQEEQQAGPVDTDPAHAMADLRMFLGAVGMPVPEGYDRMDIPPSTGRNGVFELSDDDSKGTGLYL